MTKPILKWFSSLLALTSTGCGIAFAANNPTLSLKQGQNLNPAFRVRVVPHGGDAAAAAVSTRTSSSGTTRYATRQVDGSSTELANDQQVRRAKGGTIWFVDS